MHITKMNIKTYFKRCMVILLFCLSLFLAGCPNINDNIYNIAEEQYSLGWVLHNIDDSTPSLLSYSPEELSAYTYSFNYPAQQPTGYYNINFWISPLQDMAAASWANFGVPANRTIYLKGDDINEGYYSHTWSFSSFMEITYEENESSFNEEHYLSEYPFDAIKPLPGERKNISFGTAPYLPTSIIVDDNIIRLNRRLIKDSRNNSYVVQRAKEVINYDNGTIIVNELTPQPKYSIHLNGNLINIGNLTDKLGFWDHTALNHLINESGLYNVEVIIPLNYPIFSMTKVNANFLASVGSKVNLPLLKRIEIQPQFNINEPLNVRAYTDNRSDMVIIYYKTDATNFWIPVINNRISIMDDHAKEIDLKIYITNKDSQVIYEISPASLRSVKVSCKDIVVANFEDSTNIDGVCRDVNSKPVGGLIVKIYEDGLYLGRTMSDKLKGFFRIMVPGVHTGNITAHFGETGVYEEETERHNCIDSDGGLSYNVYGAVSYDCVRNGVSCSIKDSCIDRTRLREGYCVDQYEGSTVLSTCRNGCVNGACVNRTIKCGRTYYKTWHRNLCNKIACGSDSYLRCEYKLTNGLRYYSREVCLKTYFTKCLDYSLCNTGDTQISVTKC